MWIRQYHKTVTFRVKFHILSRSRNGNFEEYYSQQLKVHLPIKIFILTIISDEYKLNTITFIHI